MNRTNKIIDIIIGTAEQGGVENVINMVAPYLQTKGYKVRLIQFVWENVGWLNESIEFYPMREGLGDYSSDQFVEDYRNFIVKNDVPDLILATNWPLMSYVARSVTQELDVHVPIISWVHSNIERYRNRGFGGIELLQYADAHLAINETIKNDIIKGIADSIVLRVMNPVDTGELKKYCLTQKNRNHKLLFVGRLSPEKRIELIIMAISQTKEKWTLEIVGEGDYEQRLKQYAKEYQVEAQIQWKGWSNQPWQYAKDKAFLVMPSAYEGFPLTAIEANSCGLPIIATPVNGITEFVEPGVNGYIVPFDSVQGIVEVLDYVSAEILPYMEPEDCIRKSGKFDKDTCLKEYVEIFNKIIRAYNS